MGKNVSQWLVDVITRIVDVETTATAADGTATSAASLISSHVAASSGVHGATGSVVGTTDTQTLSNKTIRRSATAGISAAGVAQGTATALATDFNEVTTVAVGAAGVRLPTAVIGSEIVVVNADAGDGLSVYPATGAQIDALGANNAYSLTFGGKVAVFRAFSATQWYSHLGA